MDAPELKPLIEKLRNNSSSKYVFVNTQGKPWTKNAIRLQITRLRRKLGLDPVTAYMVRHLFGTQAIMDGTDVVTLSELMGHEDLTLIKNVYTHLAKRPDYLKNALAKATRSASPRNGNGKASD